MKIIHKIEQCRNPEHNHSDSLELFGLEYEGHWIEITIDGSRYSARIDGGNEIHTIDFYTMTEHIDHYTRR